MNKSRRSDPSSPRQARAVRLSNGASGSSEGADRLARRTRRRTVAGLVAKGRTIGEIARELKTAEDTVCRDLKALRAAAAARRPWDDPAACAAGFIEAAEDALQKVRAAQHEADPASTLYLNLVKLEWTMLIKFIEMTAAPKYAANLTRETDDDQDFTTLTNEQLLQKGREFGLDVAAFERALNAAEDPQADEDGPDGPDAGDFDEAA